MTDVSAIDRARPGDDAALALQVGCDGLHQHTYDDMPRVDGACLPFLEVAPYRVRKAWDLGGLTEPPSDAQGSPEWASHQRKREEVQ